jgi:hypothetical protein
MAVNTQLRFTAHMIDDETKKGTVVAHLYIDDGQTVAAVKTALGAWVAAVAGLSDAGVRSSSATIEVVIDPATFPVTAASDLEETGNFDFNVATTTSHWGETILALKDSVLVGNQIDETNALVTALTGIMASTTVLGGNYTDRSNRALGALAYTFQGDRKRRAKLHQISYKTV